MILWNTNATHEYNQSCFYCENTTPSPTGGRCRYSPGRFQASIYLKYFAAAPTTTLHEVFLLLAVMCWDEYTECLTLRGSLHPLCRAWKLMSVFVLFVPGTGHCYLQLHSLAMPPAMLTCTHDLLNPCPGSSGCCGTIVQVIQKNTSKFIILLWLLCERAWKEINSPETNCFMNYSDANSNSKAFLLS